MGMLINRHRQRHDDQPVDVDLDKATKPQLVAYATEHGIDVDPKAKKGDILESIRAAEQGPGSDDTTGGTEAAGTEDPSGDAPKTDDDPASSAPTE